MKRFELWLSAVLLPVDWLLLVLAGISAYYLRFTSLFSEWLPVVFQLPFLAYFKILAVIASVWLVIFIFVGLYFIRRQRKLANEIGLVIVGCSLGLVLIAVYIFFFRELFSSRFIVLVGWFLAMVYLGLARIIISLIRRLLYHYSIGVKRVVLVGASKTTEALVHYFSVKKELGYVIVKRFDSFSAAAAAELTVLLAYKQIDEVIQSDPNLSREETLRLFDFADEYHLTFKYAADLLGTKVLRVEVSQVAGLPLVEVKKTSLDGWGRILKRLFDIAVSAVLIILLSPLYLLTAVLIKLDSRGPIFFSRLDDGSPLRRVGQGGRSFRYFKFRSMLPGTDSWRYGALAKDNLRPDGPMVKIKNDPRVTRIGKFIRRFSIDELTELFLVFGGQMSLVGPRPHLPEEVAKYQLRHKKVLTIKPGVTGLAQVSGRSDLSFEDEVRLDTYYLENWSLWLDLMILFKTPWAVLRSRQAA